MSVTIKNLAQVRTLSGSAPSTPPKPSVEVASLRTEVALLKAQLVQAQRFDVRATLSAPPLSFGMKDSTKWEAREIVAKREGEGSETLLAWEKMFLPKVLKS